MYTGLRLLFIVLKPCRKVVNTTVIAKDIESLISILSNMDRTTGATAPVATTTISDGKQTIASVMPFSSADKLGPYKDWKAEVIVKCMCCSCHVTCHVYMPRLLSPAQSPRVRFG